ncbi:MAG: hypothetical protein V3U82_02045 [Robiginitomaculum sp.]
MRIPPSLSILPNQPWAKLPWAKLLWTNLTQNMTIAGIIPVIDVHM